MNNFASELETLINKWIERGDHPPGMAEMPREQAAQLEAHWRPCDLQTIRREK